MEFPENVWVECPGNDGVGLCGTLSRAIWGPGSFDFLASSSLRIVTYTHADHICVPGRKQQDGLCQLRLLFEQTFLEARPSNFCFFLIGQGWVTWPPLVQSLEDDGEGGVAVCPISHLPRGVGAWSLDSWSERDLPIACFRALQVLPVWPPSPWPGSANTCPGL